MNFIIKLKNLRQNKIKINVNLLYYLKLLNKGTRYSYISRKLLTFLVIILIIRIKKCMIPTNN